MTRSISVELPEELASFLGSAVPDIRGLNRALVEVARRYKHLVETPIESESDEQQLVGVIKYWRSVRDKGT